MSDVMSKMRKQMQCANFPFENDVIFAFEGGSAAHGVKLDGICDTDIFGVFIPTPKYELGLDKYEHFVSSTSDNSERNGPDDVDVALFSLRKFAYLACKGNPSVIQFLFAEGFIEGRMWWEILRNRSMFLAKSHADAFIGYAHSQLHRLNGEHGRGKHGQRPELEQLFGFDVKAGFHLLRLLGEAQELLDTWHITLPRPDAEKEFLLCVRRGEVTLNAVEAEFERRLKMVRFARDNSTLPDSVDRVKISRFIAKLHLDYWRENESV